MNKKVSIIIIGILCLMTIVLLILLKDNEKEVIDENSYVLIDNQSIWTYKTSWQKADSEKVNNKNFNVYIDSVYKGNYTLKYGNKWNLFNDNKYVSADDNLIALSDNITLENIRYEEVNENDLNDINKILSSNYSYDLDISKIEVDLDNNEYLDYIISVSNLNNEGQSKYFNLVYLKLNGDIQVLIKEDIKVEDYYLAPIYKVSYILDIEELNSKNIVVNKGFYSDAGENGNIMYQLNGKKYEIVVED